MAGAPGHAPNNTPTISYYRKTVPENIVPINFSTLGKWNRDLSLVGAVVLIINRTESPRSTYRPRWSVGQEWLAERLGVLVWFVRQSLLELRRKNLLEVEHAPLPGPDNDLPRSPAIFTPHTLCPLPPGSRNGPY